MKYLKYKHQSIFPLQMDLYDPYKSPHTIS